MTWTSIFIAGLITYFTRMGMITLIDKDVFNENFRKILNYVPSVVFPSIIFLKKWNVHQMISIIKLKERKIGSTLIIFFNIKLKILLNKKNSMIWILTPIMINNIS